MYSYGTRGVFGGEMEVKIKEYKVRGHGSNRAYKSIYLPKEWASDVQLQDGDIIDVLRDERDRLIIRKNIEKSA